MTFRSVFLEAIASARSQPAASLMSMAMVAALIFAVLLTSGRTVAAEQQVLTSIDAAGTRSITIRADEAAGLTASVLDRLAVVEGIEWVGAFSGSVDGSNDLVPGGARVPVRYAYGSGPNAISGTAAHSEGAIFASPTALHHLGLPFGVGTVALTTGLTYGVHGTIDVPDFLVPLEPLALIPHPAHSGDETVSIVVIVATSSEMVAPVSEAAMSVLGAEDPSRVSLATSDALVQLSALVGEQLASFSRGLILALLGLMGGLLAAILFGLVLLRRKDFGRRRALGASRAFIATMLVVQTACTSVVGTALGLGSAVGVLTVSGDPLPGPAFMLALCVLTVATASVAALVPGYAASRRDPLVELRVP